MKNVALELQRLYKLDIASFTRAAMQFQKKDLSGQYELDSFMIDTVGDIVPTKHLREAQVLSQYIVQEAVRNHNMGAGTDPETVIKQAKDMTDKYFAKNPWDLPKAIVLPEGEVDFVPTRAHRAPKGSGMSKKDRSVALFSQHREKSRKELLDIFVKELGLTPAGASTYVHNCQKGLWK